MKITYYFTKCIIAVSSAVMVFSCTDIVPQAYDPGLSVDLAEIDFRYAGESKVVKITSNNPWALDVNGCDWVTPSTTSGESTEKVILTVGKNPDANVEREAELTVTSGDSKRTITVVQERNMTYIDITVNTSTPENPVWEEMSSFETAPMLKEGRQEVQIRIESNALWNIETPEWIKASKSTGGKAGDESVFETVTLTIDNTDVVVSNSTDYRDSEVQFATYDETATLKVRQQNSYSNCYVVNAPGTYTIPAGKNNGTPVTADKAVWMFESEEGLISGTAPVLADGKITFTVAESKLDDLQKGGYGVIALMSGSDVTWSYAIWYTKELNDVQIGNDIYMDRNLMAWTTNLPTSTYSSAIASACGCLYQWGSKNPLPGPSETALKVIRKTITDESKFFTDECAIVGNFNTAAFTDGGAPVTSYTTNNTHDLNEESLTKYPWIHFRNQYTPDAASLWSDVQKSVNDPCPAGYRVPTGDQLNALASTLGPVEKEQPFDDTTGQENWARVYTINGQPVSFMNPGQLKILVQQGVDKGYQRVDIGGIAVYQSSSGFEGEWGGVQTVNYKVFSNYSMNNNYDTRSAAAVRCVKM